jgi:hypothetical protein
VTDPSFAVSDDMVREVLTRLRARGVVVPDTVVESARGLIRQELGYEAVQYAFGRTAEFRRRVADDPQVQEALGLIRRARSPQDLLSLAVSRAPASKNR